MNILPIFFRHVYTYFHTFDFESTIVKYQTVIIKITTYTKSAYSIIRLKYRVFININILSCPAAYFNLRPCNIPVSILF